MTTIDTSQLAAPPAASSEVDRKLRAAWRKQRRFTHTQGLATLLVWLVGLVLADLLIDWLFVLPGVGRVLLLAVNVVILGYIAWTRWFRYLRSFDPRRVALQVERRHPELQSLLVSYVQLRDEQGGAHASPALVAAMRRQAIDMTQPVDFKEIVNYNELRRLLAVTLAMVLAFGAVSINWGDALETLTLRMLNPTLDKAYPTRTTIELITRDQTVQSGAPVTFAAKASGLVPSAGELLIWRGDGEVEVIEVTVDNEGRYQHRIAEAWADCEYAFDIGDARSPRSKVHVITSPRIRTTALRLEYPDYTDMADETVDRLNVRVPWSTQLRWQLGLDKPVAKAELLVLDRQGNVSEVLPFVVSNDGSTVTLEREAAAMHYRMRWTVQAPGAASPFVFEDATRYAINVVPDTAPVIDILEPDESTTPATVRKTLDIRFRVTDDYGIREGWLVYRLNGEDQEHRKPIELKPSNPRRPDPMTTRWSPADNIPELKPGDVIDIGIEVSDNRNGEAGPNVGRSRQNRRLEILSVEEYLKVMAERRAAALAEVESLHAEETDTLDTVDKIKREAPGAGP